MEFGSIEYQIALWELFNIGRIGSAMATIGVILAVWLSLRIAVNTRNNPETNLFAKIVSTAFGLIVIASGWIQATIGGIYWTNTAAAFAEIKSQGMEISPAAEFFIDFVGTTEPASSPTPLGMAFFVVVAIIILAQIWYPKQD
tara:strand:+ start:2417 stop:2845 length:429 start_codon:yes stop_codon:yes gene_type:complete